MDDKGADFVFNISCLIFKNHSDILCVCFSFFLFIERVTPPPHGKLALLAELGYLLSRDLGSSRTDEVLTAACSV